MTKKQDPVRVFSADPHDARENRIAEIGAVVRAAMAEERASYDVVAAHLGLSSTELKRCCSPSSGRHLSLADAAGLPPAVLRRVLDHLADTLGCVVVDLPEAMPSSSDLHLLATAQRKSAEAVAAGLDAIADGHVTRSEGADLRAACRSAIRCLVGVDQIAGLAVREGVAGVRGQA